jgi:hypothetical protein
MFWREKCPAEGKPAAAVEPKDVTIVGTSPLAVDTNSFYLCYGLAAVAAVVLVYCPAKVRGLVQCLVGILLYVDIRVLLTL